MLSDYPRQQRSHLVRSTFRSIARTSRNAKARTSGTACAKKSKHPAQFQSAIVQCVRCDASVQHNSRLEPAVAGERENCPSEGCCNFVAIGGGARSKLAATYNDLAVRPSPILSSRFDRHADVNVYGDRHCARSQQARPQPSGQALPATCGTFQLIGSPQQRCDRLQRHGRHKYRPRRICSGTRSALDQALEQSRWKSVISCQCQGMFYEKRFLV